MSLLPSLPESPSAEDAEPKVIGVDSEDAEDLISALQSETARTILAELHEEPAPPGELADRIGTSLQNAQYHLERLSEAGAVEVVDTGYSSKGREMDIYGPADAPLVIFAGKEDDTLGLKAALSRLLGSLGILALASLVVQRAIENDQFGGAPTSSRLQDGAESGAATPTSTPSPTPTPTSGDSGGIGVAEVTQEATPTEAVTETQAAADTATPMATSTPTRAVADTATPLPTTVSSGGADVTTTATGAPGLFESVPPGLVFFLGGATALVVVLLVWYVADST
jgi:DNA-binding transcriptional ArsR family regulator